MELTYAHITYHNCRFCQGKNHCRQCAAEVEATLLEGGTVSSVRLDFRRRTAALSASDEDAALDALERAGVLL